MYRENVLNGTKCVLFPILYHRNVLGGTKWIFASRIVRRGRVMRSDSSAQVLRNSRPEFRLLPLDTGWLNSWTTWRVRVLLYLSAIDRKSVWYDDMTCFWDSPGCMFCHRTWQTWKCEIGCLLERCANSLPPGRRKSMPPVSKTSLPPGSPKFASASIAAPAGSGQWFCAKIFSSV